MKNFYHLNPTKKPQSAISQSIAARFCQNTPVLFIKANSGKSAIRMMVWMLLALNIPFQDLLAQPVGSPCHAVRWSEGGHWTGVGANGCGVDDAPNAPQPQGVVRCANAADTESGIDPNTTYNPATFQIVPNSCIDPDDFSPTTVTAPFTGQKLSWFNFDVRPYAGLYDFQTIATGSYELNWALYADTLTQYCGTGTDDLSGSCGGTLVLLSCGTDFNGWAPQPFITPIFNEPTNLFLAVWRRGATNSSNDAFDFTFKARYGCGDFCFTQLLGPDTVTCNPNGTYTVRQNINATNTTITVTAPGNSGIVYSHSPFVFTTASANPAVNTGWVEVTFPASVNNYSITFTPSTEASSDFCDILNVTGVAPDCCTPPTCSTTGPSTVCPSSVTEICGPVGATGYAWSISGGGTITGAANQQCVTVTASSGCNTSYTLTLLLGTGDCTSTCMKTVTVLDNTAPVLAAAPANVTVECVANVPANINLGWTDNCSAGGTVPGVTGPLVGDACGGTITRTWNVSDACGNPAATRTQVITVDDNTAPVLDPAPANVTVECLANVPPMVNLTWTDNCSAGGSVAGIDGPLTGGACGGTITRTWNVMDACGNPAITRTQIITVDDNTAPVLAAAPANVTVECVGNVPAMTNLTWTDNCSAGGSVAGVDGPLTGGACGGTITRTWNVMDACGNPAITRTQIITVDDNTAPVLATAPANVTVECVGNVPAMTNLTWTDNCSAGGSVAGVDGPLTGGACGGTITRTWNVMDACGNPAITRTQIITVDDNTAPVLATAPANVTVECLANVPAMVNLSYTDNCSPAGSVPGVDGPLTGGACGGTITRTWNVMDACGNPAITRTQIITVDDNTAPVLAAAPANVTVSCLADVPPIVNLSYTDNCSPPGIVAGVDGPLTGGACGGTITRTWNVMDACGNPALTRTQTITVDDNIPPVITTEEDFLDTLLNCDDVDGLIAALENAPTATDNCDASPSISLSSTELIEGVCIQAYVLIRTWVFKDDCNNVSDSFTQTIAIVNLNIPQFTLVPESYAIPCTQEPVFAEPQGTAFCDGTPLITEERDTFPGVEPGSIIIVRTFMISDLCGNFNPEPVQQTITVLADNIAPLALEDNAGAVAGEEIVVHVLDNDSDNSSLDTATLSIITPPLHGVASVNPDGTISYTADEGYGGLDSLVYVICDDAVNCLLLCDTAVAVFAVVYVDADPDSATTCVDFHVIVNVLTNDTASVGTELDPTTLKIVEQPANGTAIANLDSTITYIPNMGFQGIDTITYAICDTNILMPACDTSILIVTTRDTTDPVIICPMVISPIECPAVPQFGIVTATDECDTLVLLTVLNDSIPGECPEEYTLTKTWTATDDAGNTATCVQTIEVVAITPPVCAAQDITVTTDIVDGYVLITAEDIDNGSTDNCGPVTLSISQDSFTCADEGLNLVTLTVTDLCGNTSTCTAIVTVEECFDPCVRINAWVYLEGAATDPNGQPVYTVPMRKSLNDLQVLPGQTLVDPFFGNKYTPSGQPYNIAPWNYAGTEGEPYDSGGDPMMGDAGYPPNVVDWVLVSVRADSAGTGGPLCQAAALLHSNGYIDFVDTFECCDLNFLDSFYIVVEHRNHLIVMSDTKLPIIPGVDSSYMIYNFTTQQSYVDDPFGFGVFAQKEILPGVWAMFAGNGDQVLSGQSDTDINFDDRSFWEQENGDIGEYHIGDYNLNGDTNFNDRVTWERNNGVFTSVPRD